MEIHQLFNQGPKPYSTQFLDTLEAICPFPKCALWARHGLTINDSNPANPIYELVSCISVCRIRCTTYAYGRTTLAMPENAELVSKSLKALKFPVCSHYNIGCLADDWKSDCMPILLASSLLQRHEQLALLQRQLGTLRCISCAEAGTYSHVGLVARFVPGVAHGWLDIEMLLTRPVFDFLSVNRLYSKGSFSGSGHWDKHACKPGGGWVSMWWKWAAIVAEGGFDWRARLPTEMLQRPDPWAFPKRPLPRHRLAGLKKALCW